MGDLLAAIGMFPTEVMLVSEDIIFFPDKIVALSFSVIMKS